MEYGLNTYNISRTPLPQHLQVSTIKIHVEYVIYTSIKLVKLQYILRISEVLTAPIYHASMTAFLCILQTVWLKHKYTDYAGLEISVNSRIAWPFSRQIAIGNAGPILTLESMGAKQTFRCHFLNISPSYKQYARKSLV